MKLSPEHDVLIVGAGHAGAAAAVALRQAKFTGSIGLVGDEPEAPYERPPLSKGYLGGETAFERMLIRPPAFWNDREIALCTGRRVVTVDPDAHRVQCSDGVEIGYGSLIWAAGGTPRELACEGGSLLGVHTLRTRADADRIRQKLDTARRVAVIGGGYIGLESAAVLVEAGKSVTVVEAQDRLLARVAGEPLSRFYQEEHRSRGVDIRLGAQVDGLLGTDRVEGVRLGSGEVLRCDLVIVGVGITPSVDALLAAGAAGLDGVEVDASCRTSLPDVFAIGDCALHRNGYADGAAIRLESVQNANDQASVVAQVLTGKPVTYTSVPWFWSKQYDLRLQTVGLSRGHDTAVVRGDPSSRQFSVIYLREGRVVALDCVNAVKDYTQGRRLVVDGARPEASALRDTTVALKDL